MSLGPNRKRLSQEVVDGILDMIRGGRVALGRQIPTEGELASLFHVSRTAVREGVKALAAIGALEIQPGVGTFVRDPQPGPLRSLPLSHHPASVSTLLELLEFRRIVEPEIAALAAQRATPAQVAELERCVAALEAGVVLGVKPPEDLGFHLALAQAAHNSMLLDVSSLISRFYEGDVYLPDAEDVSGHRAICQAVAARDPGAARGAMRAHLDEIERRYHSAELGSAPITPASRKHAHG